MPFSYKEFIKPNEAVRKAFSNDIQSVVAPALETAVKENTPVQTGTLKASVSHRPISEFVAEVYTRTEYAVYVEFGTIYMAPRAMFRKGAAIVEAMGDKLLKSLRNVL